MTEPHPTSRAAAIEPTRTARMLDAFQRQFAPSGDPLLEIAMVGVPGPDATREEESYEEALVRATHAALEGSSRAGDDGGTDLRPFTDLPAFVLPFEPIEGRVRVDLCVVAPTGFPGSLGDVQGIVMPIVKQRAFASPPAIVAFQAAVLEGASRSVPDGTPPLLADLLGRGVHATYVRASRIDRTI